MKSYQWQKTEAIGLIFLGLLIALFTFRFTNAGIWFALGLISASLIFVADHKYGKDNNETSNQTEI